VSTTLHSANKFHTSTVQYTNYPAVHQFTFKGNRGQTNFCSQLTLTMFLKHILDSEEINFCALAMYSLQKDITASILRFCSCTCTQTCIKQQHHECSLIRLLTFNFAPSKNFRNSLKNICFSEKITLVCAKCNWLHKIHIMSMQKVCSWTHANLKHTSQNTHLRA